MDVKKFFESIEKKQVLFIVIYFLFVKKNNFPFSYFLTLNTNSEKKIDLSNIPIKKIFATCI